MNFKSKQLVEEFKLFAPGIRSIESESEEENNDNSSISSNESETVTEKIYRKLSTTEKKNDTDFGKSLSLKRDNENRNLDKVI